MRPQNRAVGEGASSSKRHLDSCAVYSGHMTQLDRLAGELHVSGRTLRRAATCGLIRAERPSPYKISVSLREAGYVRRHWPILGALRRALRTQHDVRLAVLYGSFARGSEHELSDLDILVAFDRRPSGLPLARLALRLEEEVGRPVQLVTLEQAEGAKLLLADVLRDGRVIVDREGLWLKLGQRARAIERAARREEDELVRAARDVLEAFEERV